MLSAVENYGSAAAATHAYVHHHNFSIAAAAAAAGTAAAAAAAVIPSQQAALEHHHHHLLAAHSSLNGASLLLPSNQLSATLPSPDTTTRPMNSRSYSTSSLLKTKNANNNSLPPGGASGAAMSSAEFLRPHPKQPRYNGSNNALSNSNNPAHSPNSNSDLNGGAGSNGIPLHMRNNKVGNISHSPPSRPKYSSEQSGPVNLATSNNNNGGGNSSTPPMKSSPGVESLPPPSHSPNEREREILASMYPGKNLVFPTADPAAVAAYQYSRALAAGRPLYNDPAFYQSLVRGQLHRPPYLPEQFSTFLHPPTNAYSPPGASTLLGPPSTPSAVSSQLGSPHSASNHLNNSHNNSTNSPLSTTQLPLTLDRHSHTVSSSSSSSSTSSSSSMHHPSSPHLPQASLMAMERQQQLSFAKEKEMKTMSQLNGKSSAQIENQAGFKVPSGKEGSMKHRILTRPQYGEKDAARHRSPVSAGVLRNCSNTSPLTNFTKGSLIELSTGELRRVEDMRTEDFVQSAERSQRLELADSTVVKISSNSQNVSITFSYNKNRSKVDIDASLEHPFFVYGQGWASCNPELTLKTYGLKCQRLQVGDVCISLKPRESPQILTSNSYVTTPHSPTTNYPSPNHQYKDDVGPQNLSRKSSSISSTSHTATIPTTATGTAVSSRLSNAMPQLPPIMSGMSSSHLSGPQSYEMLHTFATSPPVSSHSSHHISPNAIIPQQLSHQQHQHQLQRQRIEGHVVLARNSNGQRSPPVLPLSTACRPPPHQQSYYMGSSSGAREQSNGREPPSSIGGGTMDPNHQMMSAEQQAAIDASATRKRRWSWSNVPPKGNEGEGGGPMPPRSICNANC